ncbi:MAG: ABC transporter ATP-binding protein [Oscillochloridaceae bacterium umkhey_bin13]
MTTPSALRSSWWYIAQLITFRPWRYLLSSLGIISFYLWPLLPGLLIRQIFDLLLNQTLLTSEVRASLWAIAAVLIGVVFGRALTTLAFPFGEKASMLLAETLMRHNLLQAILRRPGASALPPKSSSGEAVSRLRDDLAHISVFMTWTADPIGQLLAFSIAFITLARIDLQITLFGFLPLVIILGFVKLMNDRIRRYRKAHQESIGRVTGLLGELFGAVQAVKLAGAEEHVVAHLQQVAERRRTATLRDQLLSNLIRAFSFGAANIATGILLILAAQSLQQGDFTVGDFALFATYLGWMAFVIGMVGDYVAKYQQVGVSIRRATDLLQGAPSEQLTAHAHTIQMRGPLPSLPEPQARMPLQQLEVRNLVYRYPNSEHGVQIPQLRIARGQFVVVTGRIGSGKSTLLRVLLGLLPAQASEVRWNDQPINDLANFMIPPQAAYTPQIPRLFSESLRDNLLMGRSAGPEDAWLAAALQQAVLELDLAGSDLGLETKVGPRGVRLSGGQLQRAAAARMFVRQPELLVFDDLSSALDGETERQLWERLAHGPERATVLAVSHRRAALQRADWIIVLQDGQITAQGQLADLLTRSDELRAIWQPEASPES